MKITTFITFVWALAILIILHGCKNNEPEIPKSSEKSIADIRIASLASSDITFDASSSTYTVTVPRGTDLKAIAVDFSLPNGAACSPKPGTVQDFSQPVTYTVTAEDGSTQIYKIVVQMVKSNEKEISNLKIMDLPTTTVSYDAASQTFDIRVPYLTDVRILWPVFSLSAGAKSSPASMEMQDFTNPVVYTVTAEDGSTKTYTFRVTVSKSSDARITGFSFKNINALDVEINQAQSYVSLTLPVEALDIITKLEPEITLSEGATITPAAVSPMDFSGPKIPVTFDVTAADGVTKKQYKVYVNIKYEDQYWSFETDGVEMTGTFPETLNQMHSESGADSPYQITYLHHGRGRGTINQTVDIGIYGTTGESPLAAGNSPTVPFELTMTLAGPGPGVYMHVWPMGQDGGVSFKSYVYDSNNAGKITFTRVDKYYLEGTFEGSATNNSGTVKITKGKFKIFRRYSDKVLSLGKM